MKEKYEITLKINLGLKYDFKSKLDLSCLIKNKKNAEEIINEKNIGNRKYIFK
jgi:hypothetical protein